MTCSCLEETTKETHASAAKSWKVEVIPLAPPPFPFFEAISITSILIGAVIGAITGDIS